MAEKSAKSAESPSGEKKPATEKPAAEKAAGGGAHGGGGGGGGGAVGMLTKMPVLLGGAMLAEAIVLIVGFKIIAGGPKNANGADLTDYSKSSSTAGSADSKVDPNQLVEIDVVDFKAINKQSGRTFLYDVSIYITAEPENEAHLKDMISSHSALIEDRVRTIIAESDPDKLGGGLEPGLETLRRQIKYQLDEILGDGMVDEVLIPRCIPYRTDF
ncbi:MAG TPA: hypothetical protein VMD30_00205 [Tepidisphaeraceae bacterium]|nr:hypothetical protein [Tepidisphaeraceae bacterium]